MLNFIDVNEKYNNSEPNAYYKGFVSDNDFYKGYMLALKQLSGVLDIMHLDDEFLKTDVPILDKTLKQVTKRCTDYIREAMEFEANEAVVVMIDAMSASEYCKKKNEIFGNKEGE